MKKKLFLLLFFIILSFCFCACLNNPSSEKVYTCTVTDKGTEVFFELTFSVGNAVLSRRTPSSYSVLTGEYRAESENRYNVVLSEVITGSEFPDSLKNISVEINENQFSFISPSFSEDSTDITPTKPTPTKPDTENPSYKDESDELTKEPDTEDPLYDDETDESTEKPSSKPDTDDDSGVDDNNSDDSDDEASIEPATPVSPVGCSHSNRHREDSLAPTCTEDGYEGGYICDDCSKVLLERKVIPALGHDYVNKKCTRCNDIYIYGSYKGISEKYVNGDETTYLKTKTTSRTLVLTEKNTFSFSQVEVVEECFAVTATVEDGHVRIKNLTNGNEIHAPEADEYGYSLEKSTSYYIYTKVENNIQERIYFNISDTGTIHDAIGTHTFIESTTTKDTGSFEYDKNTFTVCASNGKSYIISVFDESFEVAPSPVKALYYLNNEQIFTYIFPDSALNPDYLAPIEEEYSDLEWYLSGNKTLPYSPSSLVVSNGELKLYAFVEYYDTFNFGKTTLTYNFSDYNGNETLSAMQSLLLNEAKVILPQSGFTLIWKANGKTVTALDLPHSQYYLKENRKFVLEICPNSDNTTVIISDEDTSDSYYYFPLTADFEECTSIDDVLAVLGIAQGSSEYINYSYTSNTALSLLIRKFEGITITYVSKTSTVPVKITACSNYTIENKGCSVWYTENETFKVGDSVIFNSSIALYSSRYSVCYNTNEGFVTNIYLGSIPAINSTELSDYTFKGFFVGTENIELESFNLEGDYTIQTKYEKQISFTEPTLEADGEKVISVYNGEIETLENMPIPVLNEEDYSYIVINAPNLLASGQGRYESDIYGIYEVTLPKLSTHTFTYNEIEYTISMGEENTAIISYGNNSEEYTVLEETNEIVFTSEGDDITTPIYNAVLNSDGFFSLHSVSENPSVSSAISPQTQTTYKSYQATTFILGTMGDSYYIFDEDGSTISYYQDYIYNNPEFDGNVYIQSGLYISFKNNAIYISNSDSLLPMSNVIYDFEGESGKPIYIVTSDTLTINGTSFTLNTNGGTTSGSVSYDSVKQTVVLSSISSASQSYTYSIVDGKIKFDLQ